MSTAFDAIVLGTGQAGPSLAARLAAAGRTVAIVERGRFGGTCVNTGCIPTKTLVASARVARFAQRAVEYGVVLDGPPRVDMKLVKARKDEIVRGSTEGVEGWLRGLEGVTVFQGHARFEAQDRVRVGDDVLTAPQIFLNVGARPFVPPLDGIDDVPFLTNVDMMEVDYLPRHLVVVGGSYIGLEFGQMFRRFGSEVTVVERSDRIISREDEAVSAAVQEILEAEGIAVETGAECIALSRQGEEVGIRLDCGGEAREVFGSHVLLAVGRRPNTDDLGLEHAGLETDERGFIPVDDQLHTSVPGIYALGDVNGRGAFTHTSYNDFEIVAANLLDDDPRRVSDRIPCYALYTDPPLARVGMNDAQARASGRNVLVGHRAMAHVGRAKEMSETHGFMRFLVDADTQRLLGGTILGVGGDEVIHAVLDVMAADAPYTAIQRTMHIHPTVSELVPTTLGELKPLDG
ncbi:MAG: FAD-containing oxidoreductase [Planctomycetota bacterium]|nr:FAD-containing oxidoreductase [Planctomycetota bacterium]